MCLYTKNINSKKGKPEENLERSQKGKTNEGNKTSKKPKKTQNVEEEKNPTKERAATNNGRLQQTLPPATGPAHLTISSFPVKIPKKLRP